MAPVLSILAHALCVLAVLLWRDVIVRHGYELQGGVQLVQSVATESIEDGS